MGYHGIIITTNADDDLVYQTDDPYMFSSGADKLFVVDITWIKNELYEVLLVSCPYTDCEYPTMLISKIDSNDHKILSLNMAQDIAQEYG